MWTSLLRLRTLAAVCLWLASLFANPAWAHLMPAQQGTLNVVDDAVFAVLALPVSLVPQADANGDGRLSDAELRAHAPTIQRRVTKGLQLFNAAGTPQAENGRVVLVNLLAEPGPAHGNTATNAHPAASALSGAAHPAADPGAAHFLALVKFQFSLAPKALSMDTDLFGATEAEQQLTLKVSRGDLTEAAVLRPGHATHRFFRTPLKVFADYVETGVEHIVLGTDHVLFLVTIIVAGAGWRYWLAVLTSFTLAHSITLTLGLLGWVKVSPAVVEPLIAASIVLMASWNLVNLLKRQSARPSVARQATLVFACGLLHGLGFASSMADMGLHSSYQLASLLGFNLGIELGQALCLAAVLTVLHGSGLITQTLTKRVRWNTPAVATANACVPQPRPAWQADAVWLTVPAVASVLALAIGSYWVLARLG